MTLNQILRISKKENLCIVEILLLYLLSHNDFTKNSPLSEYMNTCGTFSIDTLKKLSREKYLDNFNSPNEYYPEMFSLTEKSKTMFADVTIGEEFWKAYPAAFYMRGKGANFIARTGVDKEILITEYLNRIGFSSEKHKFVLRQLSKYEELVRSGIINGHKIRDFVKSEMWDVIAEFNTEEKSFGKDV